MHSCQTVECIASSCIILHLLCYCLSFIKFNLCIFRPPPPPAPLPVSSDCLIQQSFGDHTAISWYPGH